MEPSISLAPGQRLTQTCLIWVCRENAIMDWSFPSSLLHTDTLNILKNFSELQHALGKIAWAQLHDKEADLC